MTTSINQLPPAPRFMLGAGLLIWGWLTGFTLYAISMAILLESSHWTAWRWPIADKEINSIADLSGVIFFIVVVYIFATEGSKGIFIILTILPFILFLLILVQLYSEPGRIKLSALFISLRRIEARQLPEASKEIDISLPYVISCLLAASAGERYTTPFFIVTSVMIAWILWLCRPKSYRLRTWVILLTLSLSLAYAGQIGMIRLQGTIEAAFIRIFDHFAWRYRDPGRTTTAIGSLGRLKFSDRILLRVDTDQDLTEPLYLREAVYDSYGYGVWRTTNSGFTVIDPDSSRENWTLHDIEPDREARISTYMINEAGVIPLPHGTGKIKGAGIIQISRNPQGTINMDIREGWINYLTEYRDGELADSLPNQGDLVVTGAYRQDFERLAGELQLAGKPREKIVTIIERYFADNFHYSLEQKHRYPRGRYLSAFLFEEKSGHCEFFATSTVLLLRMAGIPARYAVGYVVSEYSQLEGQYIARARHSHAWALAYVNDQWRIIDTTPAVWAPLDEENASGFQPLMDLWAWFSYKLSRWQSKDELEEEQESTTNYLLWLLIPLLAVLAWRLFLKERILKNKTGKTLQTSSHCQGLDSSFYRLVKKLEDNGSKRRDGETMHGWITRIEAESTNQHLGPALNLHYRYRFDPEGETPQNREELERLVEKALDDGLGLGVGD